MLIFLLFSFASPPQRCPAHPKPRIRWEATLEDHQRSAAAQRKALERFNAHEYDAALQVLERLVADDRATLGEDAAAVAFDYTLLALTRFERGDSSQADAIVRGMLGVPPTPALFTVSDPDYVLGDIAIHADITLGEWSVESIFRFLVDRLAAGGSAARSAHAVALQWYGRSLTLDDRLPEARVALSAALEAMDMVFGPSSPRRAECFFQLAIVDEALCDTDAARRHYVDAIGLRLRGCANQQTDALHDLEVYGAFLRGAGFPAEADFIRSLEGQLRLQFFPSSGR